MPRVGLSQTRILDVAEDLVEQGGIAGLSIAGLAQHFGVKPPSLYKHIDDLQGLRVALALRGWEGVGEGIAELAREGGDPRQMARQWWRFSQARPGVFVAAEEPSLQQEPAVSAARARAEARAERVFEAAGLHGAHAEHAWRALRALIAGMSHLSRQDRIGTALSMEESFSRALGALFRGWR